MYIVKLCCIII